MATTYQKTFWKNEHEMEVPVPLEDWPLRADYLTVDKDGRMIFWSSKPFYDDHLEWVNVGKYLVDDDDSFLIGGFNSIWQRP
jgi:hypothetical protein